MRFYAEYGDEARLTALLERGIVNVLATDEDGTMAMDLAKRGSYDRESKEWVQSEGHKACVPLLEEAIPLPTDTHTAIV